MAQRTVHPSRAVRLDDAAGSAQSDIVDLRETHPAVALDAPTRLQLRSDRFAVDWAPAER